MDTSHKRKIDERINAVKARNFDEVFEALKEEATVSSIWDDLIARIENELKEAGK